ncbi:MAG: hypothetical protein WD035_07510 [Balneolaceae bacterium]
MKLFNCNNSPFSLLTILFLLVTPLLFLGACDVTSSEEDDEYEEHSDPWGLALIQGENEIARQHQDRSISYKEGDHIELLAGEDSPLITVQFIDQDGDFIEPDHLDEDSALNWDIVDKEFLDIDQNPEDNKWSFHFVGLSEGETTVTFDLLHGGHSDFTSSPFTVHVHENSQ